MMWKGFFIESYRYIQPKGIVQWLQFIYMLPIAWLSFHWICLCEKIKFKKFKK